MRKGYHKVKTTKRWAWKQPFLKESVTAHWSKQYGTENVYGLKYFTETMNFKMVMERSVIR